MLPCKYAKGTAAKLGVSYASVWRIAHREFIDLEAGRAAKGRKRVSADQREAVIAAGLANPEASQAEIARALGISRVSVSRIEGGRRRRGVRGLQPG
jgi:CRP-like cAMP-binding protein